jgi:hypothetical protein
MAAIPIIMHRTRAGLAPASAFDAEELDAITMGAEVEVTIKQKRSLQHHRFFFKTLSEIVKSGAVPFNTVDELLDALKMACGITQLRQSIGGAPYYVPGSISFAAKDQPAFKAFQERAFALIAQHYGIDPVAVLDQRRAA